jgi:hypothetical protein
MKLHRNAALSWSGRRLLVEHVVCEGWTLTAAAEAADVSLRCARKWVVRYREQGEVGLADRSSAPHLVAHRTPPDRVAAIIALRRLRFTAAEIAEALGMALSTVSGIPTRLGLGRLGRLGLEAARRYERCVRASWCTSTSTSLVASRAAPASGCAAVSARTTPEAARIARGTRRNLVGWEHVHIAIDDYSRLAYAEVLPGGGCRVCGRRARGSPVSRIGSTNLLGSHT